MRDRQQYAYDDDEFETKPRGSSNGMPLGLIVAIVAALVLLVGGVLVVFWFSNRHRDDMARRPPEDPNVKRQDIADAFGKDPFDGDNIESPRIQVVFDRMSEYAQRGDADGMVDLFDLSRMMREFERVGLPKMTARQESEFRAGMRLGLRGSLQNMTWSMAWERTEMRKSRFAAEKAEVEVFTRHRFADGMSTRFRWWLRKEAGTWRFYDFEDLEAGMRLSTLAGALLSGGMAQIPKWSLHAKKFPQVLQLIQQGELAEAEKLLNDLATANFPNAIDAMRLLLLGGVQIGQFKANDALKSLSAAEVCQSDMPALDFLRCKAYNQLAKWEFAETHARKFLELMGPDAETLLELGDACRALNKPAEALDAYRKGLDDVPESIELFHRLRYALGDMDKAELGPRFLKLPDRDATFAEIAGGMAAIRDQQGLEAVLTAYQSVVQESDLADYYEGRLRLMKKDFVNGFAIIKRALSRFTDADERQAYLTAFLYAMQDSDKECEAYDIVDEKTAAFRILADGLVWNESKEKVFIALVDHHRNQYKDDPQIPFYLGRIHLRKKEFDAAIKEFDFAAEKVGPRPPAVPDEMNLRYWRVEARLQAGRGLEAYEQVGPARETFSQLLNRYYYAKDAPNLAKLVEAHRKREPEDPELPFADARVLYVAADYAALVKLLQSRRDTLLGDPATQWTCRDMLFRALLRTNRLAEARRELLGFDKTKDTTKYYWVLLHAKSGDVAMTLKALEALLQDDPYYREEMYADEDLGPALATKDLRDIREKYPEQIPDLPEPKEPSR